MKCELDFRELLEVPLNDLAHFRSFSFFFMLCVLGAESLCVHIEIYLACSLKAAAEGLGFYFGTGRNRNVFISSAFIVSCLARRLSRMT